MSIARLTCTRCRTVLPWEMANTGAMHACAGCRAPVGVELFPAFFRGLVAGTAADRLQAEGESACFYHPQSRAVVPCDGCGRFLCGLCDVELDGRHLCPNCVETGRRKGRLTNLEHRRVLYDNIALGVALLPLLIWPVTLVTAPMAVFLALRYWKAPTSLVRGSRVRLVAAMVIGAAQLVGWALLVYTWVNS
jgi:hypothetical protein